MQLSRRGLTCVCDATSVRTCRYFAQPYSLLWELLLVWVGPLLRGWPYISQSKCNEVRDPGYCIGSLHPILVFHKETNCRQNFCFVSNLIAFVPTLAGVSFCFFQLHICLCVCAIITSSGGKEQQSTSVPSALALAASFLHLFGTLLLHRARPSALVASSRVGIIGSIGSIGSIKQSK